MENAVFKATNRTECIPKAKHLQYLVASTFIRDTPLIDLFRCLSFRLKENSWVVVFKTLIVIHTLIRQGDSERVLACLASQPHALNIAGFRDRSGTQGSEQTKNIHAYAMYLEEKVAVFRELKLDFTNEKSDTVSRLRKSTEKEGWLLNDISILQREIDLILKCKFYLDEVNNEVTLTAYRLIVTDLLKLFHVENEGVMNLLEHYFEMVQSDARKSLNVYKTFCTQTAKVVEFLDSARRLQTLLGTTVPKLKHAPISLAVTLEEYLNSPDFETNRIEYKASRSATTNTNPKSTSSAATSVPERSMSMSDSRKPAVVPSTTKDDKDIIDFFSSIDNERITAQFPVSGTGYGAVQGFGVGMSVFPAGNPFGVGTGQTSQYSRNTFLGNISGGNSMGIQQQPFGTTTSMHNPFTPRQGSVHPFGSQQAASSNPFAGPSQPAAYPMSGSGTYATQTFGPTPQYSMMSSSGAVTNVNQSGAPMSVQRESSVASMGSTDYLAGPNNVNGGNRNIGSFGVFNTGHVFASQNPFASVANPAPHDSLSSLNPFPSKPTPASSLPMASMMPGRAGFSGGHQPTNMGAGIFAGVGSDAFGPAPTFQPQQNFPYQQQQQQQFQQQRQPSFPQQYQEPPGSSSLPWG